MKLIYRFFLFLFALAFLSCGNSQNIRQIQLNINKYKISAEVADTANLQEKGLMNRKSLDYGHGMLFMYKYDDRRAFWMKNTSIPLSIAFISSDGTIKEIYDMEPFSTKIIKSKSFIRYALEVNQGEFQKNGIVPGDKVIF